MDGNLIRKIILLEFLNLLDYSSVQQLEYDVGNASLFLYRNMEVCRNFILIADIKFKNKK